jgi:hypothetical protein
MYSMDMVDRESLAKECHEGDSRRRDDYIYGDLFRRMGSRTWYESLSEESWKTVVEEESDDEDDDWETVTDSGSDSGDDAEEWLKTEGEMEKDRAWAKTCSYARSIRDFFRRIRATKRESVVVSVGRRSIDVLSGLAVTSMGKESGSDVDKLTSRLAGGSGSDKKAGVGGCTRTSRALNPDAKPFTPMALKQLGGSGGGFVKALDATARCFFPKVERERRRRYYQTRSVAMYIEECKQPVDMTETVRSGLHGTKSGECKRHGWMTETVRSGLQGTKSETRGQRVQHETAASVRKHNGVRSEERKPLGGTIETVRSGLQGTKSETRGQRGPNDMAASVRKHNCVKGVTERKRHSTRAASAGPGARRSSTVDKVVRSRPLDGVHGRSGIRVRCARRRARGCARRAIGRGSCGDTLQCVRDGPSSLPMTLTPREGIG